MFIIIFTRFNGCKKTGVKGKVLRSQAKEIIRNISKLMKKEAREGIAIPLEYFKYEYISVMFARATGLKNEKYHSTMYRVSHFLYFYSMSVIVGYIEEVI